MPNQLRAKKPTKLSLECTQTYEITAQPKSTKKFKTISKTNDNNAVK